MVNFAEKHETGSAGKGLNLRKKRASLSLQCNQGLYSNDGGSLHGFEVCCRGLMNFDLDFKSTNTY